MRASDARAHLPCLIHGYHEINGVFTSIYSPGSYSLVNVLFACISQYQPGGLSPASCIKIGQFDVTHITILTRKYQNKTLALLAYIYFQVRVMAYVLNIQYIFSLYLDRDNKWEH